MESGSVSAATHCMRAPQRGHGTGVAGPDGLPLTREAHRSREGRGGVELVLGGTFLGLVARHAHNRILTGAVALALSGLLFGFATS